MMVSINGKLIDEDQAMVSVFDHGFLYGIGLFETFRTYNGIPFLFDEHLHRLSDSCRQLSIDYIREVPILKARIMNVLQANGLQDGYVRISISAGTQPLGMPSGNYSQPSEIIYAKALPERNEQTRQKGKPLQLLELRRNTPEGPLRTKSFQYMNNVLATRELQQYPWASGAEGLFLNASNHVAEGLVSNVFFIYQDRLFTPALSTGILSGITRKFVLNLADRLGIAHEEGLYSQEQLYAAEDIFMTNSIQEILPVSCIYNQQGKKRWVRTDEGHSLTQQLIAAYQKAVDELYENHAYGGAFL